MPFRTSPKPNSYVPSHPLPQHLAHKPIYALPYEKFDGIYASNTDVRYLSIGTAQYDADHVSIKTMRYVGKKWTRQAEELPLHRVIDMALLLAKVLFDDAHDNEVHIPAGTFHNQTNNIHIAAEQRNYGELASYDYFLSKNKELYAERFNALLETLQQLKNMAKI